MSTRTPGRHAKPPRTSFYGQLVSSGVSILGTRITTIALPWLVLQETNSATLTGLVITAEMAPFIVVKALAGPYIDRQGPRLISIISDLGSAVLLALIPILYAAGQLSLPDRMPLLLGLLALIGALRGPGDGARNAAIPVVAESAGMSVEKVSGYDSSIDRAALLLGAGVGGVLVTVIGAANTVGVTAALSFISAIVVTLTIPKVNHIDDPDESESYLDQLREGARYLANDRLLASVMIMTGLTNTLEAAYITVMLPIWAKDNGYGPDFVGFVGVLYGAAAVASGLVATGMAGKFSKRAAYFLGFSLAGAPRYLALAMGGPPWLIVAANLLAGCGSGLINPTLRTIFFERVPRSVVGRVNSLAEAFAWTGLPFGGLVGGLMVRVLGVGPALGVAGAAYLLFTAVPGARPEWREMDEERKKGSNVRRE